MSEPSLCSRDTDCRACVLGVTLCSGVPAGIGERSVDRALVAEADAEAVPFRKARGGVIVLLLLPVVKLGGDRMYVCTRGDIAVAMKEGAALLAGPAASGAARLEEEKNTERFAALLSLRSVGGAEPL